MCPSAEGEAGGWAWSRSSVPSLPQPFSQQHPTKWPQCPEQGWVPRRGSTSGQVQASLPVSESEESGQLPAGRREGGLRLLFFRGTCTCLTTCPPGPGQGPRTRLRCSCPCMMPPREVHRAATQVCLAPTHSTHTWLPHTCIAWPQSWHVPRTNLPWGQSFTVPLTFMPRSPCGDVGSTQPPPGREPCSKQ